jgi:3-phosphoshikimate 1-carboxyvinyltransferase
LLAGLTANNEVTVIEDTPTRDHTENMLRAFGFPVETNPTGEGGMAVTIKGQYQLQGCAVDVPADPSSAAFPVVAALLVEGSEILIPRVCLNERRAGLYKTLIEMGGEIIFESDRIEAGERVADLRVKGKRPLEAIEVPASRVASMIDEFPILSMAAACARGTTKMTGLDELRVKESDRLAVTAQGLKDCGVKVEEGENSLLIYGNGCLPEGGAMISTHLDHRIAMSFLVLGTVSEKPIEIDDASPIRTSFPTFIELMNDIGCRIS